MRDGGEWSQPWKSIDILNGHGPSSFWAVGHSEVTFEITYPSRKHSVDANNSTSNYAKVCFRQLTINFGFVAICLAVWGVSGVYWKITDE